MIPDRFSTRQTTPEGPAIGHSMSPRRHGRLILIINQTGTIFVHIGPPTEGRAMPKRESARSKERAPEALVEWMLKAKGASKRNIRLLLSSTESIRRAWDQDDRGTKAFPMNTAFLLGQIDGRLRGLRPRKPRKGILPKVPTRLRDILQENTVQQVHVYLHEEPFLNALDELRSDDAKALGRIKETIDTALDLVCFGEQALPKPRGNWLHRQILSFIQASTSEKFTDSELAELFDYFCPCGSSHNREAMKKFRWRQSLLKQ
jgi:hypothetical protein